MKKKKKKKLNYKMEILKQSTSYLYLYLYFVVNVLRYIPPLALINNLFVVKVLQFVVKDIFKPCFVASKCKYTHIHRVYERFLFFWQ